MQSLLRQIVAGPRTRHPEANLDLCYVTENVIATSGPSVTYPSLAYRNPLNELVHFLDSKHGSEWCIWEFRAEGTGYSDEEVYSRIWHFPWPDHHPPPFALVPKITATMRNWLHDDEGHGMIKEGADNKKRVVVVHCKAGKGRSGTMAISYLMTHEGWTKKDALQRFTERRMRPGFGSGISIPSQLRWIDYVERWCGIGNRMYVERPVEVTEVHVWGLRAGVTLSIQGYVEEGKVIKTFHTFNHSERDDYDPADGKKYRQTASVANIVSDIVGSRQLKAQDRSVKRTDTAAALGSAQNRAGGVASDASKLSSSRSSSASRSLNSTSDAANGPPSDAATRQVPTNTIFKPASRIMLESSDINLDMERRAGWSNTLASVAHVWFNCFFEGNGPENYRETRANSNSLDMSEENNEGAPWADKAGVFEIEWDNMDGLKGSSRKGARAFDRVAVVWRAVSEPEQPTSDSQNTTPNDAMGASGFPTQEQPGAVATSGQKQENNIDHGDGQPLSKLPSIIMREPEPGEAVSSMRPANQHGSGSSPGEDAVAGEETATSHEEHSQPAPSPGDEGSDSEDDAKGVRRGVVGLSDRE